MKKCQLCGKECGDNATVCEECASAIPASQPTDINPKPKKAKNFPLTAAILGIIFPIAAILPILVAIVGAILIYIASVALRFLSLIILIVPFLGILVLFPMLAVLCSAFEVTLTSVIVLLPILISLLLITASLVLSIIALTKKQHLGIAGITLSSIALLLFIPFFIISAIAAAIATCALIAGAISVIILFCTV